MTLELGMPGSAGSGQRLHRFCTAPRYFAPMRKPPRSYVGGILINLVGIGAFLRLASESWIEPELVEISGASGGAAFVWFLHAVPVLLIFTLGNAAWLFLALRRESASRRRQSAGLAALMLVLWLAAALFDNMHHGI
jgi:hypothetical protein